MKENIMEKLLIQPKHQKAKPGVCDFEKFQSAYTNLSGCDLSFLVGLSGREMPVHHKTFDTAEDVYVLVFGEELCARYLRRTDRYDASKHLQEVSSSSGRTEGRQFRPHLIHGRACCKTNKFTPPHLQIVFYRDKCSPRRGAFNIQSNSNLTVLFSLGVFRRIVLGTVASFCNSSCLKEKMLYENTASVIGNVAAVFTCALFQHVVPGVCVVRKMIDISNCFAIDSTYVRQPIQNPSDIGQAHMGAFICNGNS